MAKIYLENKISRWQKIKNSFFPGIKGSGPPNYQTGNIYSGIENDPKNLNKWRGPVQVLRLKVDLSILKNAVIEAERPLSSLPYRVLMQTIFLNTIDNGHVFSCVQKRKDLTLLKEFHICDENGVTDEKATELINTDWFHLIRNYLHDARYYGYSLITFGDMIQGAFPNVQITRRTDVSPDRENLASFQYIPTGIQFLEGDYYDWSLWVSTPSENGVSKCGYGLLYKVAPYEIIIRTLTGWNTDYTERYGMPTPVIKTNKDSEEERDAAEEAAQKLGSSGYLILDKQDEYELINGDTAGTGWKSYDNLEARCKKAISTIILGHEDGLASSSGKLSKDDDESPQQKALKACESIDTKFEETIVNNILIPKLIKLGIKIPLGKKYKLKNDNEKQETSKKEAKTAQDWATVAKTMSEAGLKMDPKIFSAKSGVEKVEGVEKETPQSSLSPKFKEKLNKVYASK
jgi:hypothetical protein